MKPIDLRNAAWHEVLTHIAEDHVRVHLAWQAYGPGTTREVAQKSGISVFTLRPRTTELYQLGLVVLVDSSRDGGIYAYRDRAAAEVSRAWQQRADFREKCRGDRAERERVGFMTVDEAIASLSRRDKKALAGRLMAECADEEKRCSRGDDPGQLSLLPA